MSTQEKSDLKVNVSSQSDLVSISDLLNFLSKWKILILILSSIGFLIGTFRKAQVYQTIKVLEISRDNQLVLIDPEKINHAITDGFTQKDLGNYFSSQFFNYLSQATGKHHTGSNKTLQFFENHFQIEERGSESKPFASESSALSQFLQTHYTKKKTDLAPTDPFLIDIHYSLDSPVYTIMLRFTQSGIAQNVLNTVALAFNDFVKAHNDQGMTLAENQRDAKKAILHSEFQSLKDNFSEAQSSYEKEISKQKMEFYRFETKILEALRKNKINHQQLDFSSFGAKDNNQMMDGEKYIDNLEQRLLIKHITSLESANILSSEQSKDYFKTLNSLALAKREPELRYAIESQKFKAAYDNFNRALTDLLKPIDRSTFAIPTIEIKNDFLSYDLKDADLVTTPRWVWGLGGAFVGFLLAIFSAFIFSIFSEYRRYLAQVNTRELELASQQLPQ